MDIALQDIAGHWLSIFTPPPRMTVSEWAVEFRWLSPESCSNPGQYTLDFTPWAKDWMDTVNEPDATGLVLMVASQLGKTEALNNVVGYFIDIEPSSILMVQPTEALAEAWSKERLAPMIRDTPVLQCKVAETKTRDSGNTLLYKSFPGGNIAIAGANAPSGLAGRPRRVVLLDEEDRFPQSAGKEGDPASLAIRRTESYWNAFIAETSTPTVKGISRIEARFEISDQRRWVCECPRCSHPQSFKWAQVGHTEPDGSDAWYQCENPACGGHLTDEERRRMSRAGKWVADYPERALRGYHLNGIASLFRHKKGYKNRLHQMVSEHLDAKAKGPEALRTWVNTFLAETWEDDGESVPYEPLMERRENWNAGGEDVPSREWTLPAGAMIVTAGADVQGDRVEIEFTAWGPGEESWSIGYEVIMGDFNKKEVQDELDSLLESTWRHPSGVEVRVSAAFIDSGNKPKSIYEFTKKRERRKVYACKGRGGPGVPLISRPTRQGKVRAALFTIGTDTAKDLIYSRLQSADKGAGYMHFPSDRDETWFRQLTAETKVTRYRNGVPYSRFENPSKARNEALDCRVYSFGALQTLTINWKKLAALFAPVKAEDKKAAPPVEKSKRPPRSGRGGGWLNNY